MELHLQWSCKEETQSLQSTLVTMSKEVNHEVQMEELKSFLALEIPAPVFIIWQETSNSLLSLTSPLNMLINIMITKGELRLTFRVNNVEDNIKLPNSNNINSNKFNIEK